jgi:hypothetical protein
VWKSRIPGNVGYRLSSGPVLEGRREARSASINQSSHIRETVIIYLFSNEISKYLGLDIRFTFGLGTTFAMTSFVKLESSLLHLLRKVLSLGKIRALIRLMRYSDGGRCVRLSRGRPKGEGYTSGLVTVRRLSRFINLSFGRFHLLEAIRMRLSVEAKLSVECVVS